MVNLVGPGAFLPRALFRARRPSIGRCRLDCCLTPEVKAALLLYGDLLDGLELAFEAPQLGCGWPITLHKEGSWPEDDEGNARCYGV
jgi:hypothetical protein